MNPVLLARVYKKTKASQQLDTCRLSYFSINTRKLGKQPHAAGHKRPTLDVFIRTDVFVLRLYTLFAWVVKDPGVHSAAERRGSGELNKHAFNSTRRPYNPCETSVQEPERWSEHTELLPPTATPLAWPRAPNNTGSVFETKKNNKRPSKQIPVFNLRTGFSTHTTKKKIQPLC